METHLHRGANDAVIPKTIRGIGRSQNRAILTKKARLCRSVDDAIVFPQCSLPQRRPPVRLVLLHVL